MVSRSFGRGLTEFDPVCEALASCVTCVGETLRRERRHARQMMIFQHNSPFDTEETYFIGQASFQLPHPTSDTSELIHHACTALTRIFRPGIHYNKCGVTLTELTPDTENHGDFLDTRDTARSNQLMTALDATNRRMDRDTIF
jgi:DNA polymerase V